MDLARMLSGDKPAESSTSPGPPALKRLRQDTTANITTTNTTTTTNNTTNNNNNSHHSHISPPATQHHPLSSPLAPDDLRHIPEPVVILASAPPVTANLPAALVDSSHSSPSPSPSPPLPPTTTTTTTTTSPPHTRPPLPTIITTTTSSSSTAFRVDQPHPVSLPTSATPAPSGYHHHHHHHHHPSAHSHPILQHQPPLASSSYPHPHTHIHHEDDAPHDDHHDMDDDRRHPHGAIIHPQILPHFRHHYADDLPPHHHQQHQHPQQRQLLPHQHPHAIPHHPLQQHRLNHHLQPPTLPPKPNDPTPHHSYHSHPYHQVTTNNRHRNMDGQLHQHVDTQLHPQQQQHQPIAFGHANIHPAELVLQNTSTTTATLLPQSAADPHVSSSGHHSQPLPWQGNPTHPQRRQEPISQGSRDELSQQEPAPTPQSPYADLQRAVHAALESKTPALTTSDKVALALEVLRARQLELDLAQARNNIEALVSKSGSAPRTLRAVIPSSSVRGLPVGTPVEISSGKFLLSPTTNDPQALFLTLELQAFGPPRTTENADPTAVVPNSSLHSMAAPSGADTADPAVLSAAAIVASADLHSPEEVRRESANNTITTSSEHDRNLSGNGQEEVTTERCLQSPSNDVVKRSEAPLNDDERSSS